MKHLLSLIFAVLVAITAFGQSSPTNKLRSNDSFTQVDNYLVAAKRLGIPSGPVLTLDASVTSEDAPKLFWRTSDSTLHVYVPALATWLPAGGGGSGGGGEWGTITGDISDQIDLQDSLNAKVDTTAYGFGLRWNPATSKMDWGEHLEAPGFSGGQYVVKVPEASIVGLGDITSSDASFLAIKMGALSSTGLTVGDRSTAQNIGIAAEDVGSPQLRLFSPGGYITYSSDGVLNYSADLSSSYTNRSVVDKAYVDVQVSDSTLKNIYVFNPRAAANIKTIAYTWKDGRDSLTHIGYTAQDVQKYLPEAVELKGSGVLGVRYLEVLAAKIAALEERLTELESK